MNLVNLKFQPPTDDAEFAQYERDLYAQLERDHPELWRVCYPRIYHDPRTGQYHPSKKPARQIMLIALKILAGKVGPSEKYEYHLASHLAKFRVPMFWLSPSIAQALKLTAPPGKFDWYNMPLPFEAGVFMPPKGSLVHATDGDATFVCYARFRAGEVNDSPLFPAKTYTNRTYTNLNGGMILAAGVEKGYFIHWNIPLDAYGPVLTLSELQDLMKRNQAEHQTAVPVPGGDMTPHDHALGLDVAHFIFSSLMLMSARPELVAASSLVSRVPAKKNAQAKEFWSPAIIGEHYKIRHVPGPSQGGTHASPRFHWVRGALREQPYGPRRELRRTVWIEPYTRGGGE